MHLGIIYKTCDVLCVKREWGLQTCVHFWLDVGELRQLVHVKGGGLGGGPPGGGLGAGAVVAAAAAPDIATC